MKGVVVAPQPLAVEEAIIALRKGGNAIDAAVTAAFVQGVIDPLDCGIGGFGVMCVHTAGGEDVFLDFNARAGSRATPDMWANEVVAPTVGDVGYVLRGHVNEIGYQSIGVPGTVLGLHEAWRRFGTLSWEEVLEPAIHHARTGYTIPVELVHNKWEWRKWRKEDPAGRLGALSRLTCTPATAAIYSKNGGRLLEPGDLLINSDLARSLEVIAQQGAEAMYTGSLAKRIVEDMEANGGLITREDLESYEVIVTEPLRTEYRGYTLTSAPAPCGGITVLEILNILEGYDLGKLGLNTADYVDIVSLAMKAAFADRNRFVGDPLFTSVPSEHLLSKAHAREWQERIDRGEQFSVEADRFADSPDTTHVSVVDQAGNCVSLTHSLGICSGVVSPGLGFLYNEWMRLFDPTPGGPNAIAPGKRRVTGMTPTIVFRDGEPSMVLGAPGGNRIMGAVLQTILNVVDHHMGAVEAVSAPRFDCQGETIEIERRIPRWVCAELTDRGRHVVRDLAYYGSWRALVQLILMDPSTGVPHGASDPRGNLGIAMST